MNAIEKSFAEALALTTTLTGIIDLFDTYATAHAGTAPAAIKRRTIRALRLRYGSDPNFLWEAAITFTKSGNPTAEEVGAIVLAELYPYRPKIVTDELKHLADSPNWEVREWAGSALGDVVTHHFESVFPAIRPWVQDPSENIRRALLIAAMDAASSSNNPVVIHSLLDLLGPLLRDRSPYVQNNLGPFALGHGFAKHAPDALLSWMTRWVAEEDEQVRWNLAMVFSAKNGADLVYKAQPILQILSHDTRPRVQKAWKTALRSIRKRIPGWDGGEFKG